MRLSSNLVKQIIDEIPAIVVIYKEKPVFINKYAQKLTGYTEEEAKEKYIWDFCLEDCKKKAKERVLKRIKGEFLEEIQEVHPFIKKNGSIIYLKCLSKTIKIDNQYYGITLAVDITKEVELKNTIKLISVPIQEVEIDKYGNFINLEFLNDGFFKLTGYSKEDIKGSDFFVSKLHPDDRKKILSSINKLFMKDEFTITFRFKKKNGKYLWIKEVVKVLERNKKIRFISTWFYITKEKKLEEKLKNTLKNLKVYLRMVSAETLGIQTK